MTKLQELEIEYEGMLGTIKQYSCDPYVISYLNQLKQAIQSESFDMIRILIVKLNQWYEENIFDIETNRWVVNVDSHRKTQKLLQEFQLKFN
jgi:GTP:adenosylcobinamide-phosphate guanylyltransferase